MKAVNDHLYHYTREANARSIVENCEIWFRNRKFVDKGQEHTQLIQRLNILWRLWHDMPQLVELFTSLIEGDETYVACFCETPSNDYLWKHYGDKCIELDAVQIGELRNANVIVALRMEYLELSLWEKEIRPLAERLAILAADIEDLDAYITKAADHPETLIKLITDIYISLLETKERKDCEREYAHECEVRLMISPLLCAPSEAVKPLEKNGETFLKLELHYSVFKKIFTPQKIFHPLNYYDPMDA